MKYNLVSIMRRAWELRREKGYTMPTALRLAWMEAKGTKGYAFKLENARAQITTYLVQLMGRITDTMTSTRWKSSALRCCCLLMQWGLPLPMVRPWACASTHAATHEKSPLRQQPTKAI